MLTLIKNSKFKQVISIASFAIIAFILRVINFKFPINDYSMDEAYYIPESISTYKYGYEVTWFDPSLSKTPSQIYNALSYGNLPEPFSYDWASAHPPLGKLIASIGIHIFGNNPLGWRIAAIMFGVLLVVFTMLLAYKITNNLTITLLSGFFVTIDPMSIAMSRTMHLDIFLTLFAIAGIYFFMLYLDNKKILYLIISSMSFGFSVATKWSGVFFYSLTLIALLYLVIRNKTKLAHLFVSIGIVISSYLSAWVPWFYLYSLPKHNSIVTSIKDFFESHLSLLESHASLLYYHPYSSSAFSWILPSRPVLFSEKRNPDLDTISSIWSTPNIIFWISSIISLLILVVLLFKNKSILKETWILVLAVAFGWLPWFFTVDRTIFQFYTISFQPYLYIILAYILIYALNRGKNKKISIERFLVLMVILVGSVLSFRLYDSAVGLPSKSSSSGYALNSQWQDAMVKFGFYKEETYEQILEMEK